jgi:ribonucleoside-diphosphate reductase alpha chain
MDRTVLPKQIRKRDGSLAPFKSEKIEQAIQGAANEILQDKDRAALVAQGVTGRVLENLSLHYRNKILGVESIQDLVEAALMREGYGHIARAYILYREERSEIRMAKKALGLKDDLKLPLNTMEVLKRRYLVKDEQVLTFDYREWVKPERTGEFIIADSDYSGGCVAGTCPF